MRKFAVIMASVWGFIAIALFFVWWTITSGLTPAEVTDHANKVARELQIPWTVKFRKVTPRFGADFRVVFEGLDAMNAAGEVILHGRKAEVRLPWKMFFNRDPGQVHLTVQEIKVSDWKVVLLEVEKWLEARRQDSTQEVTLPEHVVSSRYNLRLNGLEGAWGSKTLKIEKLFLLNLDPRNPSAFEMVFPWSTMVNDAELSGETKVLGEYRVGIDKVDLHYYLKNRFLLTRNGLSRSGDASFEGKGFYHPRLGLFTTLAGKDEWLGLVGDLEWARDHIKINIPRFTVSHELLLDVLPFTALQSKGQGPYQGAQVQGELKWFEEEGKREVELRLQSKPTLRFKNGDLDGPLSLFAQFGGSKRTEANITWNDTALFTFTPQTKGTHLSWAPGLFSPVIGEPDWLQGHSQVWQVLSNFPWNDIQVAPIGLSSYRMERTPTSFKILDFKPWEAGPVMALVYETNSLAVSEWMAQFESTSIEKLFAVVPMDAPVVPGFAFTGAMRVVGKESASFKVVWKGSALALLSRSSCRVLLQDRPELASLLKEDYAHQVQVEFKPPVFSIPNWTLKSASKEWSITGEWSNQPIRCNLKVSEKVHGRKAIEHLVEMN